MTYNNAESSWKWEFGDRAVLTGPGGAAYDTEVQNNRIDSYSDLAYESYRFTVGGTYNFTDSCYTTASVSYDVFNSDEEYVYGDEDGRAYSGFAGIGYRF